jgi:SPW repeat
MTSMWKEKDKLSEITRVIAALGLLLAPWLVGFAADMGAAWNARLCGIVVAGLAYWALSDYAEWQEWFSGLLGVWVAIAPWFLGFVAASGAMWTHVLLGVVVILCAGARLSDFRWPWQKLTRGSRT